MRVYAVSALFLPALVACRPFEELFYRQGLMTIIRASPASTPTPVAPVVASMVRPDRIELRQAPGIGPDIEIPDLQPPITTTALPAVAPAPQQPAIPVPAIPVPELPVPEIPVPVNPAPAPAITAVSTISSTLSVATTTLINAIGPAAPHTTVTASSFSNVPFVTVVWEETFIGGTYSTWAPYTISLDFKPSNTHPPLPGKGEIGMGTLTGKTGHTETIVVVGAAPTQEAVWLRGVAVAVGVGVAGIMI